MFDKEYLEALEIECGELVEMDLLFLDRNGENQEKWHNSEAFKKAVEFEKKYGKSHTHILKQALQRLESIDNANPNEALECLEELKHKGIDNNGLTLINTSIFKEDIRSIKQALLKLDHLEFMMDLSPNQVSCIKNREIFIMRKEMYEKYQEQDFNYNKIVIPFLNELVIILGINDMDEMLDKIKEQKKVLEITKEKRVDIPYLCELFECIENGQDTIESALEEYNDSVKNKVNTHQLTQEEFELLKAYFGKNIQK